MAIEIERKFRVVGEEWRGQVTRVRRLRQAYLSMADRVSVRVRVVDETQATLTIKTAAAGVTRAEYEYAIPVTDAQELIAQRQGAVIDKRRHDVPMGDLMWEVDVFEGENAGLVIAEIELDHAEREIALPVWLGEEVTHDRRYYNAELVLRPFAQW